MVYAILALNKIGACANMINPTFTAEQMRDRINDTDAGIMIMLDQLYERLEPVISEICPKVKVIVPIEQSMPLYIKAFVHGKLKKDIPMIEGVVRWNDFIKRGNGNKVQSEYTYEEAMPAVMVYSSGTTGASKGIVLTNEGINGTIAHYDKEEFTFKRGDTFLHMGASWFSTFMIVCLLMPLQKGISVMIEPVFSEETFYKGLKKHKPVLTLGPVSLWLYVMNHGNAVKIDFSNMKYPITGGEKVLPETERALNDYLRKQGCSSRMIIGYGMCELGSTAVTTSNLHFKEGSPGYPITGVTVASFDTETNAEKKYGERGEIRVLTPNRMKEYYKRPDATAEFFWKDPHGQVWGCTGDVGYVDEDGFVYVEGRGSDTLTAPSGKTVYCFDIEDVILKHTAVHQCEVIGIDCDDGYEVPYAFVVLKKDHTDSMEKIVEQIQQQCEKELSPESRPCQIEVLERFIIKPSGKRDMELLKEMAQKKQMG